MKFASNPDCLVRHTRLIILAGFIASAAGCSGNSPTGGGGGGCSGTNSSVAVCDNFFSPTASTINAGTMITWTFKGALVHNVTFTSGPVALPGSADMSSGMFSTTFNTPGTYNYDCSIHGFHGTVTVN